MTTVRCPFGRNSVKVCLSCLSWFHNYINLLIYVNTNDTLDYSWYGKVSGFFFSRLSIFINRYFSTLLIYIYWPLIPTRTCYVTEETVTSHRRREGGGLPPLFLPANILVYLHFVSKTRCCLIGMSTTINRQQSKWIAQMLRKDIQSTTWTTLPWNPARDKETGRKDKGQVRQATNPRDRQRSWNFVAVLHATVFKGTWSLFIERCPICE